MSKTAFLFPGQGAQTVGMGRQIAESTPRARELYRRASAILGYDLAALCFEGPAAKLDTTVHSQPALFVTSLAALEWLNEHAPSAVEVCTAAAGLSLGEYTALTFAGVMEFEAALRAVQERGKAMQAAADATPSSMLSILGLKTARIEQLCDRARVNGEILQVANLLCPGNVVVSGHKAACGRVAEMAVAEGAMKAVPLAVAGAFHTPIMQPAVARLEAALAAIPLNKPRIAVISNVDAAPHVDPEEIRKLLVRQLVAPVRWEESMRYLLAQGYAYFYEVGPGRTLRGLLRRIDRNAERHGVLD